MNRGLAAAGAAALALLLVSGTPPSRPSSPPTHTPRSLRSVLPELESFVERNRVLPFRRGVDVYVLSDRDFDAILSPAGAGAGDLARQFQQTQVLVGFVKALGLGGPDFQLPTDSTGGTRSVLGLYDDVSKRISVRAGLAKPLQRRVLVHELTHALDDQHFSLLDMKRRMDPRTEQARAWQALIESAYPRERFTTAGSAREPRHRTHERRESGERSVRPRSSPTAVGELPASGHQPPICHPTADEGP